MMIELEKSFTGCFDLQFEKRRGQTASSLLKSHTKTTSKHQLYQFEFGFRSPTDKTKWADVMISQLEEMKRPYIILAMQPFVGYQHCHRPGPTEHKGTVGIFGKKWSSFAHFVSSVGDQKPNVN
jgi:hypothetical protein